MQRDFFLIVRCWWPALTWMVLIFIFSTDSFSDPNTSSFLRPLLSALFPFLTSEQIDLIHATVRKLGHGCEYLVLGLLLMRAVKGQFPEWQPRRQEILSLALAILYAASDEWHQSFVPSRSASFFDVLIDSLGALSAVLWRRRSENDRSKPR